MLKGCAGGKEIKRGAGGKREGHLCVDLGQPENITRVSKRGKEKDQKVSRKEKYVQ